MRLLHTSDWHLGVEPGQRSRHEEHRRFLEWLEGVIAERAVDVLIVAGDVFDTSNPSSDALQLYYRFLARLAGVRRTGSGAGPSVVVVGGNHDSPSRLDAPRDVLCALDAHVVGGYSAERDGHAHGDAAGLLVPLTSGGSDVRLVIAAVPYLNDWRLGVRGFDATTDEQRASLTECFAGVYSRLADRATALYPGVPVVATGHLTCLPRAGDRTTDDDAVPIEINRVGSLGALGPVIFDPRFQYVALGHIHRSFPVDPARRVWYSGTPVQVSADEDADGRRVLLVDIPDAASEAREPTVEALRVPTTRRLVKLRGDLDTVSERMRTLTWTESELPPSLFVDISISGPNVRLGEVLRERLPTGPGGRATLDQVRTSVARAFSATGAVMDSLPMGDSITPEQAFLFAWRTRYGDGVVPPEQILQRLGRLIAGETHLPR